MEIASSGAGAGAGVWVLVAIIVGCYFIPSIVGKVGWVVALAMAVRTVSPSTRVIIHRTESVCGSCGTPLGVGARFCGSCGTSRVAG